MSGIYRQQAERKAEQCVHEKTGEVFPCKKHIPFMHEGRECGESTAETYGEKEPEILARQVGPLKNTIQKPYCQTAGNVDCQRTPREASTRTSLDDS